KRGKILNLGSTASFQAGPLMAVYYATKAYVLSFSEALTVELEEHGITVTCLCPGPTQSGFQKLAEMEASKLVKDRNLPTAKEVAEKGWQALQKKKIYFVPGFLNRIMVLATRFAPRKMAA